MPGQTRRTGCIGPLLWLVATVVMMIATVALAVQDVAQHYRQVRGIESGLRQDRPPLYTPRFGVNIALEQYADDASMLEMLQATRDLGFDTIRQHISWAELEQNRGQFRWERWDDRLSAAGSLGLGVIAVLDSSPSWARPAWEADNPWAPPTSAADYGRFARAFASRYGNVVVAYQIWDEPNIRPRWGKGEIDPAGYVELLRVGSEAIRTVDPDAIIIAGGLAPNAEAGGRNMGDLQFLREIYRRGAGAYFDVLGAKPYGFWTGPDDRRVDAAVLNFSRVILLREEMVRRGDAHKPIWAMDAGWCALPLDWRGRPSPQGSDAPSVQAERTERALTRIQQEWPWMTLACFQHIQPNADVRDPIWGYALFGPDRTLLPLAAQLRDRLGDGLVLHPGPMPDLSGYLVPVYATEAVDLYFWGSDLFLTVDQGVADGEITVFLDGQETTTPLALGAHMPQRKEIPIGQRLAPKTHRVRLHGSTAQLAAVRAARVGYRPAHTGAFASIALGVATLLVLGTVASRAARKLPWAEAWGRVQAEYASLPRVAQASLAALSFLAVLLSPSMAMRLVSLLVYALSACLGPSRALLVCIVCIPLGPIHVRIGPGSFSVTELALVIAAGAHLWNRLLIGARTAGAGLRQHLRLLSTLDWAVLALVLLAMGTALAAEYRHVALREFRVVILGSAVFYLLFRIGVIDARSLMVRGDLVLLGGAMVAMYALTRYPQASGVIEAEGVRRARAFYGSPNNLALYLERVWPLGVAMALWAKTGWRRVVYGIGSVAIASALLLTFSRGAWLLGVPASLLALILLKGRRARWLLAGLACAGILAVAFLLRTERLATLWSLTGGTTWLRVQLWAASWGMVRDHPWLGVGPDNFLYYYGDYIRPGAEVERWLSHPHNLLLDFWLRLGIGGVVILLVVLKRCLRMARDAYRMLPDGDLNAMAFGLVGGVAAGLAHGLIDSSFFVVELAYWLMFALAWLEAAAMLKPAAAVTPLPPVITGELGQPPR